MNCGATAPVGGGVGFGVGAGLGVGVGVGAGTTGISPPGEALPPAPPPPLSFAGGTHAV